MQGAFLFLALRKAEPTSGRIIQIHEDVATEE